MSAEQRRIECEARHWLAHTGGDSNRISELLGRIKARRGEAGAERLRAEMRRQYREARG